MSIQSVLILKVNLKMAFTLNMHHMAHHRWPLEQPKSQPLEELHRHICLRMDKLNGLHPQWVYKERTYMLSQLFEIEIKTIYVNGL